MLQRIDEPKVILQQALYLLICAALIAIVASMSISMAYCSFLKSRVPERPDLTLGRLSLPFTMVHALFVILYFAHVIPPVPLSTSYIGIFHDVKRTDDAFELTYTRPEW